MSSICTFVCVDRGGMRFFYSWQLRDTANMPPPYGKSAEEEFKVL